MCACVCGYLGMHTVEPWGWVLGLWRGGCELKRESLAPQMGSDSVMSPSYNKQSAHYRGSSGFLKYKACTAMGTHVHLHLQAHRNNHTRSGPTLLFLAGYCKFEAVLRLCVFKNWAIKHTCLPGFSPLLLPCRRNTEQQKKLMKVCCRWKIFLHRWRQPPCNNLVSILNFNILTGYTLLSILYHELFCVVMRGSCIICQFCLDGKALCCLP